MKEIISFINGKKSLLIMIAGSGSFFLCNLILYGTLNPSDYGDYSYLFTIVTMFFALGALGFDSLLLRCKVTESGKLKVSRLLIFICLLTYLIISIFFSVLIYKKMNISLILTVLLMLAISLSHFLYQILRSSNKLILSQLVSSVWKFSLLTSVFFFVFFEPVLDFLIVTFTVIFISLLAVYFLFFGFPDLEIEKGGSLDVKLALSFIYTLLVSISISFSDRILVQEIYGSVVLGEYYYWQNFFLMPISMLASYYSFKDVGIFKSNGYIADFNMVNKRRIKFISFYLILVVLSLILCFYLLKLRVDIFYICLMLTFLSAARFIYSIYSAAITVLFSSRMLNLLNLATVFLLLLMLIIFTTNRALPYYLIPMALVLITFVRIIIIHKKIK